MKAGVVLARNTFLNLATQLGVGILAFVTIPLMVRGIGPEEFGLLSTLWIVVGYFGILDLGLSQATIKFVAEYVGRNAQADANRTLGAALIGTGLVGVVLAAIVYIAAPFITERVLNIDPRQIDLARVSFRVIGLAVPLVMLQATFRTAPMVHQRFDLVNLVQGVAGLLQWGGSLVLVLLGKGLYEIVILLVCARLVTTLLAGRIALLFFPDLFRSGFRKLSGSFSRLFRFGGWVSVSQLVSPAVGYLDRVFIGAYLPIRSMAFYTVPLEALLRLQMIPASLTMTLFPAMAGEGNESTEGSKKVNELYGRSTNYLLLSIFPVSLILSIFSHEILTLWLGPGEFVAHSATVFSLLALSATAQAVAYVPVTSLTAVGRPDVPAKLYLAEIPVYVLLCATLIPAYGVEGAAIAWLTRTILITIAMYTAGFFTLRGETLPFRPAPFWRGIGLNAALALSLLALKSSMLTLPLKLGGVGVLLVLYAAALWFICLDTTDRGVILHLLPLRKFQHA